MFKARGAWTCQNTVGILEDISKNLSHEADEKNMMISFSLSKVNFDKNSAKRQNVKSHSVAMDINGSLTSIQLYLHVALEVHYYSQNKNARSM